MARANQERKRLYSRQSSQHSLSTGLSGLEPRTCLAHTASKDTAQHELARGVGHRWLQLRRPRWQRAGRPNALRRHLGRRAMIRRGVQRDGRGVVAAVSDLPRGEGLVAVERRRDA